MRPAPSRSAGRSRPGAAQGPGGQPGNVVPLPRPALDAAASGDGADPAAPPADRAEVRLLGPLRVRRADGSVVSDRDWRTGKNADLLRWLALQAGNPVSAEVLIDGLWPGVEDSRGRASLRTAASQLRRVLGADILERVPGGVLLRHVWVDATTFVDLAEDVVRRRREGRPAEAFALAREADALYLADVPAGDSAPSAIGEHSAALAAVHRRLLGDAAEVAVELGWMRDAVDLAGRLLEVDPVSEQASRALMLGLAGLGETHKALREYERCRRALADELGVDPSAQTRAVHLQLLRAAPDAPAVPAFVGRAAEVDRLARTLGTAAQAAPAGPHVVVLAGPDGSGRRRLAEQACRRAGVPLVEVPASGGLRTAAARPGSVLLWEPDVTADRDALAPLLAGTPGTPAPGGPAAPGPGWDVVPRAVLVLGPAPGTDPGWDALAPAGDRTLVLGRLPREDVAALGRQVAGGPLTPGLVEELVEVSAGLPGGVVDAVRRWAAAGRLVGTTSGLALASAVAADEDDGSGRRALARALPRLEEDALEALLLCAVLDTPVTPSLLAPLLPAAPGEDSAVARRRATAALEQLVDLALLRTSAAGAAWRHPLLRDAVHAWMRPTVRARLHRRVAACAAVPGPARVGHWLQAGEREQAGVAALSATAEAAAAGDVAGVRALVLQVSDAGELPPLDAADRACLYERLGDACSALGRREEAVEAFGRALGVAQEHLLGDAPRLRRRLEAAQQSPAAGGAPAAAGASGALVGLPGLGTLSLRHPDAALEETLLDALDQAERSHDARSSAQARLLLAAAVCLPRRQFRAAHEWAQAAAERSTRPADRLAAGLVRHVPAVLLGGARGALQPLAEAARAARDTGEDALGWRLHAMRVLVAHDLGDPSFAELWPALLTRLHSAPADGLTAGLAGVALRVLVEREELDVALELRTRLPAVPPAQLLVTDHVLRLAEADLADACGDPAQAARLLRAVVDEGRATGSTLLVPEAAARLVAVETASDPAAALAAFEVYDDVVAAALGGPREEYWRRRARAAVRAAHGDTQGAVDACVQAGSLAAEHGLQVLAARARRARADYVRAGRPHPLSAVAGAQRTG